MTHSLHYQAIPTHSTFYTRLQEDRVFATLLFAFFPYGCGPFRFFEDDPYGENEEILQDAFEIYRDVLGPEPEARRCVAAYRSELERTRAAYPGIEYRHASLENCSQEVRERLTRELDRTRGDAAEFIDKLLFGDESMALSPGSREGEELRLVSVSVVTEGAALFGPIEPATLFDDNWCQENYGDWRRLLLETNGKLEALIYGIV
jgi:hypothetical protein